MWLEYEELLERARQQFGLLRELPLYGRVHWEDCFQKVSPAPVVPVVAKVRAAVQAALCAGMCTWECQRVSIDTRAWVSAQAACQHARRVAQGNCLWRRA